MEQISEPNDSCQYLFNLMGQKMEEATYVVGDQQFTRVEGIANGVYAKIFEERTFREQDNKEVIWRVARLKQADDSAVMYVVSSEGEAISLIDGVGLKRIDFSNPDEIRQLDLVANIVNKISIL